MTFEVIAYLLMGAFFGGFINGLAGFGTALLALGFWLQVLPPAEAVGISAVMSVMSGMQGVWIVRREMKANSARLLRFLIPALPAIPLGGLILAIIDAPILKILIAIFMVIYGAFFAFRRALPQLKSAFPLVDGMVGFLGGLLGGAAGLSGALPTMWSALQPWSKAETRAVLQPYNVAVLFLTMLTLALYGHYTMRSLILIAVAMPMSLIGAQVGIFVYHRLSDGQFRRVLIILLLGSGLLLGLRELASGF